MTRRMTSCSNFVNDFTATFCAPLNCRTGGRCPTPIRRVGCDGAGGWGNGLDGCPILDLVDQKKKKIWQTSVAVYLKSVLRNQGKSSRQCKDVNQI
ncbi:hypothetical protein BOX15_Mlig014521g2 [Macrostomum lignano]|uniref:Uncharacterized protein n=1 Tax=Macrostomum lignano TaxID=282301 RepID=A0A267H632_9PLAT|nr:hypothetical protein BOX15_Mlig014521g1 [Macrostomum lignano]PAA92999.1 hypothetical protein BOX15_Mlig014521g2 [Macrostomum lignano]